MTKDADALAFIKDTLGYQAAPVVYTHMVDEQPAGTLDYTEHWSGFDADRIKAIVK